MKFSLFAHMERIAADQPHDVLYEEFVRLCQMADEGGMRAVWTGEHHGMEFTITPNTFITLTDLAQRTRNVRLGTGTVIAPFWHPIRLAGEAAMTDLVTGGRLELGIARGAYSYEYERMMPGLDAWEAGQRMRESAPLLRRLWEGDCAHEGQFYRFPSTSTVPKPAQKDGPPIWIAARDPNSHALAVSNGFDVQVTPLWNGDAEIDALMARFDDACSAFDGPRPKIMLLHHAYVSADKADSERAAKQLSRFYNYFGAWFQNKKPVRQGLIERLGEEEMAANEGMSPAVMRANLAIGTAPEMIDRLKRYEDLGYDEYSFWIDSGMPHEQKRASLARFIDDVMPAFD